jgi:hypothetical protein
VSAPDADDLDAQLKELETEERELSAQRRRLHDRLASFPNDVSMQQERELSRQRAELHVRIDALRAERSKRRAEQHTDETT